MQLFSALVYNVHVTWISLSIIVGANTRQYNQRSIIYCVRNNRNGKCYVGKTIHTLRNRLRGHVYDAFDDESSYIFHCALRKHGIEAFDVCVLETASKSKLKALEIHHIERLGSFGGGYNATKGGEGLFGYRHKQSTKQLISSLKKGVPMPLEQRRRIQKPVQQIDLHDNSVVAVFESISHAFRETGAHNIGKCCKGDLPNAGGFLWKFVNATDTKRQRWSKEKRDKMKRRLKERNALCRSVKQISLSGTVIAVFPSVKAAREATGVSNVSAVIRGVRKAAGGFMWSYSD